MKHVLIRFTLPIQIYKHIKVKVSTIAPIQISQMVVQRLLTAAAVGRKTIQAVAAAATILLVVPVVWAGAVVQQIQAMV